VQLRETLITRHLSRVADEIESAAKASVCLAADKPSEDAITRLGGQPNLPSTFEWPSWREEPLAFVAQVDLAALPQIPGLTLPRNGALFFFFEGGENAWGFRPDDRGSSCVLFTPDPLNRFPLRSLPESLPRHLRFKGVGLSVAPIQLTIPGDGDTVVKQLSLTRDERNAYLDFQEQWNTDKVGTIHRVGGYPDCVQGDPKLEAHLVSHGLYCGDPSGYELGRKQGLSAGSSEWDLLLQVDSEEKAGMIWGDVGRIYFLIHNQDLAQRRFDKTWLVFQCF
jgi:uncharacterized protein YwqG